MRGPALACAGRRSRVRAGVCATCAGALGWRVRDVRVCVGVRGNMTPHEIDRYPNRDGQDAREFRVSIALGCARGSPHGCAHAVLGHAIRMRYPLGMADCCGFERGRGNGRGNLARVAVIRAWAWARSTRARSCARSGTGGRAIFTNRGCPLTFLGLNPTTHHRRDPP